MPSGPPSGGRVVTGTEVLDAARRAGRGNPLLTLPVLPEGADGAAGGEPGSARQWAPTPTDGASAAPLVDAVREWCGAREARVAASLVVLGYAARLVGPVVAVAVREGIVLDAGPDDVRHAFSPQSGLRVCLVRPSAHRPRTLTEGLGDLLEAHLGQLVDAVREAVPVARGLLWGNVASGLAGTLAALARDGDDVQGCLALGRDLLGRGSLVGTGHLDLTPDGAGLRFRRRSCCLYYRLDGGGTCGDCPLPPC